jgi:hypothetical protein
MTSHNKKSEHITAKKDDARSENECIIDSYDYLANAASVTDCTGLIPSGICSEKELEAYRKVYQFGAPRLDHFDAQKTDSDSD